MVEGPVWSGPGPGAEASKGSVDIVEDVLVRGLIADLPGDSAWIEVELFKVCGPCSCIC